MELALHPGSKTFFMALDNVLVLIRPQFLISKMGIIVLNSLDSYDI